MCFPPPRTGLTTPAAISQISLSDRALTGPEHDAGRPYEGVIIAVDWLDSFYKFRWKELATFLAFEHPFTIEELGVEGPTIGDDAGTKLPFGSFLWACLASLPMGFAWALHYCHLVLMRCCSLALSIVGVPDDELESCFAVDGRPAPRLSARRPIALPYVDNGNSLCWDKQAADELLLAISSVFKRLGLQFRVECDGASCCDLLGIRLIASSRRLLGKPDRIWKLRTAVIELLHQGRCSSHVLQVVNGHLVFTLLVFGPHLPFCKTVSVLLAMIMTMCATFRSACKGNCGRVSISCLFSAVTSVVTFAVRCCAPTLRWLGMLRMQVFSRSTLLLTLLKCRRSGNLILSVLPRFSRSPPKMPRGSRALPFRQLGRQPSFF